MPFKMDDNNESELREGHGDWPIDAARAMQTIEGANFFDEGFRGNHEGSPASAVFPASFQPTGPGLQAIPVAEFRQTQHADVRQTNTQLQFAQGAIDLAYYHETIQAERNQPQFFDNSLGRGTYQAAHLQQQENHYREEVGFQPAQLPHLGTGGPWPPARPSEFAFHHTTRHIAEPRSQLPSVNPTVPAIGYPEYAFPVRSVVAPNKTQVVGNLVNVSASSEVDTPSNLDNHAVTVVRPQEWDILYGRGKQHRRHPGNKRMKLLVDLHRDAYNKADRMAKTSISRDIVNIIKSSGDKGGRFLRFDKTLNGWVEVSDDSAREKVSHAMRDGKTRPVERIDPKVLDEMPFLSDDIKQDALRKIFASRSTEERPMSAREKFNADDPQHGQYNKKQDETDRKTPPKKVEG